MENPANMRPVDFGPLVCVFPVLKNPVPRDHPEVEILSGLDAFDKLNEKRNAAMDADCATYAMMACESRGWQEFLDNMEKMIREFRMLEVLGCVVLALRGGVLTANRLGRKAEQWHNLCCRFNKSDFNVNLHVGGNGGTPVTAATEKFTLIGFIKGTPGIRGKTGIVTDANRRALDLIAEDTTGFAIWDHFMRYRNLLLAIAEGYEPNNMEVNAMQRWERVAQQRKPSVKSRKQVF